MLEGLTAGMLVAPAALRGGDQPTVEELKGRLANTSVANRRRYAFTSQSGNSMPLRDSMLPGTAGRHKPR